MNLFNNLGKYQIQYFNFLVALIPLSFIAGNMIININIILIIILSLIFHNKKLFSIKFYFLDKLLIAYFILIIFTGFYNYYFYDLENIISYVIKPYKSIFFLKYLMLYFIMRYLVEKNLINIKTFFLSCLISTIFVSLDIFYQFYSGKDIFGFESIGRKFAGPFGNELIAGGFIQRFSLFSFFVIPLFFTNISRNLTRYLFLFLFIIFFSAIILSGNRMPLLLFTFSLFLIFIFIKEIRKYFFYFVFMLSVIFLVFFNLENKVKENFNVFFTHIYKASNILINNKDINESSPSYLREFNSFYDTWLLNKYIGGGIKNFRFYCHHRTNIDKNSKFICNMHPHNYYLEILTETGLIGFILITIIFFYILYLAFIKRFFFKNLFSKDDPIIPFIFLFIVEIFPVKSTGSFFTTGNSTYLFLLIGIMIGLLRKNNLIEKQ